MSNFFGELITKNDKSGETPYKLNLYNSKFIPDYKGSTSYYRYKIAIGGDETERVNYAHIIYYFAEPGNIFIPHCCFLKQSDADNFINYWNDDNGLMATGRYYFKKRVEVL